MKLRRVDLAHSKTGERKKTSGNQYQLRESQTQKDLQALLRKLQNQKNRGYSSQVRTLNENLSNKPWLGNQENIQKLKRIIKDGDAGEFNREIAKLISQESIKK